MVKMITSLSTKQKVIIKDDLDLTKADGFWEEIAKPFERDNPNNYTTTYDYCG